MSYAPNGRLHALDALRGFDMFFIMGGDALFLTLGAFFGTDSLMHAFGQQMIHSPWNGFTCIDLVFPLFLFIAGISFPYSLQHQREQGKTERQIVLKIVRRGITLVLLGCIYNGLLSLDFDSMRYGSVLGRIGLAWMFAALILVKFGRRTVIALIPAILLSYWAAMVFCVPEGNAFVQGHCLPDRIDMALTPGQLYLGNHDPEGLFSTIPAIATAMMGMLTGFFVRNKHRNGNRKTLLMLGAAIVLIIAGWTWDLVMPVNKNLWTSSFVCVAAGYSLALFSLFYWIIDVKDFRRWSFFFRIIGLNSITIYLAQNFIDFHGTTQAIFGGIIGLLPESMTHIGFSLCYIALCWLFLLFLYRNRIFLKV